MIDREVTAMPGENMITLELERSAGIFLSLRSGETIVPFSYDMPLEVTQLDGDGTGRTRGIEGPRVKIEVDQPGLYRLSIGPVPGFEEVPFREIPLSPGEWTEVEIELVRER